MIHMSAIGQLGRDAEVRDASSTKVINFSIAVNIGYGDKKTTQWVECSKFGEKTNVAEYLKKGTKVYVSGEPSIRTFEKKDGTTGTSLTLRVTDLDLLSRAEPQPEQVFVSGSDKPINANDLPF